MTGDEREAEILANSRVGPLYASDFEFLAQRLNQARAKSSELGVKLNDAYAEIARLKHAKHLKPGDMVILLSVPATLMNGLPEEDQAAIRAAIGEQVPFTGIFYGRAEVEFKDSHGDGHTIWVDTDDIKPV